MSTWASPDRTDPPQVSGERDSLDAWVNYHRATLFMKCAGLAPDQLASRSCPPSTLSLLGLVRHLTEVEGWFHDFDGKPSGEWYSNEEDPDACFNAVEPSRAEEDLAAYQARSNGLERLSRGVTSKRSHQNLTTANPSRCAGSICT